MFRVTIYDPHYILIDYVPEGVFLEHFINVFVKIIFFLTVVFQLLCDTFKSPLF